VGGYHSGTIILKNPVKIIKKVRFCNKIVTFDLHNHSYTMKDKMNYERRNERRKAVFTGNIRNLVGFMRYVFIVMPMKPVVCS
jgi:hypothetical protein